MIKIEYDEIIHRETDGSFDSIADAEYYATFKLGQNLNYQNIKIVTE